MEWVKWGSTHLAPSHPRPNQEADTLPPPLTQARPPRCAQNKDSDGNLGRDLGVGLALLLVVCWLTARFHPHSQSRRTTTPRATTFEPENTHGARAQRCVSHATRGEPHTTTSRPRLGGASSLLLYLLLVKLHVATAFTPNSRAELAAARDDWLSDSTWAESIYGHISTWNTEKITDMSFLFCGDTGATSFDMLAQDFDSDISLWNTSRVTTMNSMFRGAVTFNQVRRCFRGDFAVVRVVGGRSQS